MARPAPPATPAPPWPNVNALWADVLVDELVRCGVRHAVLSPGSRSAPLALAVRRRVANVHVVVDERSAAYFALGTARMGGAWPVLLVSTSGTAVANFHPALVEADHSGAPLVVVTADRPHELRDVGANQAIHQPGLFGATVRWSSDLMLPEATAAGLRHVRQRACRAVGLARLRQGPVHLNVPLREPLAPLAGANGAVGVGAGLPAALLEGRTGPDGKPAQWTRVGAPERSADAWTLGRWAAVVHAPRGVVVCGPSVGAASMAHDAEAFCAALGVPLLLDPLAGAHPVAPRPASAIGLPDLVLASPKARAALKPDWILQLGAAPTSRHVRAYLEENGDVPRLVVDPLGKAWDETESAAEVLHADAHRLLHDLAPAARARQASPSDASWLSRFHALASAALQARPLEPDWEGPVAQVLLDALAAPPPAARTEPPLLWVGSSLPVRDLDRYGAFAEEHGPIRVLSNRGASGIDGVLSSAAGAASTMRGRCIAYVGDLTFLHDLSGLAAVQRYAPHLTVVVLNNGGGRIFEHLPIADAIPRAEFEQLFAAPQAVDLGKACQAFGLRHVRLDGCAGLPQALRQGTGGVVEVVVDPAVAVRRRKDHLAKAIAAAERVVDSWAGADRSPSSSSRARRKAHQGARNGQERRRVRA